MLSKVYMPRDPLFLPFRHEGDVLYMNAGVAGLPALAAVGHVAEVFSRARGDAPGALSGPRQALHLRALPPRHLSHGLLAVHAPL
jgi:hypothetical protein